MLTSALVLGLLLTYGRQDVLAFKTISFSSISQCGSFNVSFSGASSPPALPLSLTVLPFNSTGPISIAIDENAWNAQTSSGAVVTFLPLAVGTVFVASLDDANGIGTGHVSDVIQIQPSDNSSCLPAGDLAVTMPYTLDGILKQCNPFNVTYDSTRASAPSIRMFTPQGPSSMVTPASGSLGNAEFILNAKRGREVVLSFADNKGNQQTSGLITVGGNANSSKICMEAQKQVGTSTLPSAKRRGLSKGSIIGIIVGSVTAVGGIATLMVLFVCRERRRRLGKIRKFTNLENQGSSGGGGGDSEAPQVASISPSPVSQPIDNAEAPAVSKPLPSPPRVLDAEGGLSPMSPEFIGYRDRGGEPSPTIQPLSPQWQMVTLPRPDLTPVPGSIDDHRNRSPRISADNPELDIDQILELATMYTLSPTAENHTHAPFTPVTATSRHRAPSDVPVGAEHMSMFYPSGMGSQMYTSEMQTASVDGSGLRASVHSFVGGAGESVGSLTTELTRPVVISKRTRAETAIAGLPGQ